MEWILIDGVNGIFKDKLVDGTGVISVAVRLGNDDGVGFVPLQPAVRFIFRYGSKGMTTSTFNFDTES